MFVEECRRAIAACSRTGLDALAREVWRAYGADVLSEAEASELCEAIAARRTSPAPTVPARRVGSRPRSSTSMERRRAWTASGWLPPPIAARFTMGEAAALGVIMAEVAMTGRCELSHGAVGGRAGVSVSTVKRAIGEARRLGLVAVAERRLTWCRNLPNVVTVASAELRAWVATRGRGLRASRGMWDAGGGVQTGTAPESIYSFSFSSAAAAAPDRAVRWARGTGDALPGPRQPAMLRKSTAGHRRSSTRGSFR